MSGRPPFSVVIAVVDPQRHLIDRCVAAIRGQTVAGVQLVVVDNTSAQDVAVQSAGAIAEAVVVRNPHRPSWFCANYNLGIDSATGEIVLALNLDAFLEPAFLQHVAAAFDAHPDVALISGKLLKLDEDGSRYVPERIDSTGIILTLDQRHLDRGTGEIDRGQYETGEYVFGVTGAAVSIRRAALDELMQDGYCFDPDYVHGREDGDLSFRAQLLGWRAWYEPRAVGYHIRTMRHGERRRLSPQINYHQVKNRWLLRINNLSLPVQLALAPFFLVRDAQALAYMLVRERTSLPAIRWLWRERNRLLAKRRMLMARRRAGHGHMIGLFLGQTRDRVHRWRMRGTRPTPLVAGAERA